MIAGANIIAPIGVLLQNGLLFGIDDAEPKQYPFIVCNNVGCLVRIGLTPLELQAMRKGETGKITVRLFQDSANPFAINVSLNGFSAAYSALTKKLIDGQK